MCSIKPFIIRRFGDKTVGRIVSALVVGAGLLAGLCLFVFYRAFPDAYHDFGGMILSTAISRAPADWFAESPSTIVPVIAGGLFFRTLIYLGVSRSTYQAIQIMNALFGVMTILLMTFTLRRITGRWSVACGLGLLVAHSYAFWLRSVECSVFAGGIFWTMTVLAAIWWYSQTEKRGALLFGAFTAGAATLYDPAHIYWMPAVVFYLAMKHRRDLLVFLGCYAFLLGAPWLVNVAVGGDSVSSDAINAVIGPSGIWPRFQVLFETVWITPQKIDIGLLSLFAASLVVLVFMVVRLSKSITWEDVRKDRPLLVFYAMFAGLVIVSQVLSSKRSPDFVPIVLALGMSAGILFRSLKPHSIRLIGALWVFAGFTLFYNLSAGIRPRSRLEDNEGIQKALFIGRYTEPGAIVAIGRTYPFGKAYVPVFAKRKVLFLDSPSDKFSKEETLKTFRDAGAKTIGEGVPLYALSNLRDDLFSVSGVLQDDLKGFSRDFVWEEKARFLPEFRLYRLWPQTAPRAVWEKYYITAKRNGHTKSALYALERRAELIPGPGGWKELGGAYARMGRVLEALSVFERVLRMSPRDTWTVIMSSRLLYRSGQEAKALALLRQLPDERAKEVENELRKEKIEKALVTSPPETS